MVEVWLAYRLPLPDAACVIRLAGRGAITSGLRQTVRWYLDNRAASGGA